MGGRGALTGAAEGLSDCLSVCLSLLSEQHAAVGGRGALTGAAEGLTVCLSVCLSRQNNMLLWEDEAPSLEQLRVADNDQVLIEVRNKDQTWPEEMSTIANLSRAQAAKHRLGMYRTAPV